MGGLKHVGVAVWCAGIVACIALSVWSGLDDIGNALATVARGCWAWCFTRAATVAIAGAGWWLLFPVVRPLRLRTAVLLRLFEKGSMRSCRSRRLAGTLVGSRFRKTAGTAQADFSSERRRESRFSARTTIARADAGAERKTHCNATRALIGQ